ncbi:MAG: hypothetical protein Aurels2KO_00450 [Aureliella sp.]
MFVATLATTTAQAQTLTQSLSQESPEKLAREAVEKGNIVRGAILFHQGNINCVSCHRSTEETKRIGPDLGQIDAKATGADIAESILMPSKVIKKGYESTSVLTSDGEVFTGIMVSEDDQRVVLRSGDKISEPISVDRADIEQIKPSTKSNMPEGLVDAMSGRQQFLDLLRYVLDLRDRGSNPASLANRPNSRQLSGPPQGLALINKMNCTACHASEAISGSLPAHGAPDLLWSARHVSPNYLAGFIADPQQAKPGTRMPHMLDQLGASERSAAAVAIVNYLRSASSDIQDETPEVVNLNGASSQQGRELFHSVGCVACHAPRDEQAAEIPTVNSQPLGELTEKYDPAALVAFLKNPHASRPTGRMPNMQLAHREAIDLASYLLSAESIEQDEVWTDRAELVAKGKQLFEQLNCASCHTTLRKSERTENGVVAALQSKPMDSIDISQGCLSGTRGHWPRFAISESEVGQIRAAIESQTTELTPQQQIDLNLVSFNCTACHSRDWLGGVSQQRSPHFQTTNLNLGEQGRIPPALSGVGAKLKPEWMRDVLVNAKAVRPYMKTRMPQYGEENVGHLVELFQQTDSLPPTKFAGFDDQKEMRTLGLEIAGNKGLNCVACHTFQYKLSDTMPAVDLTEMSQRLKKDWFYRYMLDPQKFSPNTVMPSFWPGGKAMRPDIAGDPNYQVEALWQYLLDGRQARAPRGVIREPLEIVVTDEARMLRRKYPGMTAKRGIGVGYPGGVNLAFDAEQMRLTQIWKGRFVDPSGVWYGQGHGTVRPLGRPLDFPAGPDLDSMSQPWIASEGRPPNHQFKGYELDELRRPVLRYEFGAVEVEDYFREFTDSPADTSQLRRRVKLASREQTTDLRLRLAAGKEIAQQAEGVFLIDGQLTIRMVKEQGSSAPSPRIITGDSGKILVVPITLEANEPQELSIEYLW